MMTQDELSQASQTLVTMRDCLRWAESVMRREQVFLGHGTDDYWDEALSLLLHVLHLRWDVDPRVLDARLLPDEVAAFLGLLERRVNTRMPAAYLTGKAWFCGLQFSVDSRVLVPRSPLAELIEAQFEPFTTGRQISRILDLCTGSGCIAIACAHVFPHAQVDASDISPEALAVCRENVAAHQVEDQVQVLQSDGLASVQGPYDVIVCNPPYVGEEEMQTLPQEYHHEPAIALASGYDGLDFLRRLLREAPGCLSDDGFLVVEVGNTREQVEANWPGVPFLWCDFERGGHGVFVLTRQQLLNHREEFSKT